MADRICTRFRDDDGLDIGCNLVTKEYMLENYPNLVLWMKTPGLWLWGCGGFGRLGNNSTINQSSPVQTISGGNEWQRVSLGDLHSSAIKTDGSLWLWGSGGLLGNNSTTNQLSPVQTVSGGNNWRQVSLARLHSAAIKTDGTLWIWGYGTRGRLGNNSIINQSSPVQTVSGGTNWRSVSLGYVHSAAIKTDGTLWLWGCGGSGRLGNNSTLDRSSPVQTVSGGTNWRSVSSSYHSAAIKTDGSLWLWGDGTTGQLGENVAISQSSPVQTVSGGTDWRSVSAGGNFSAAIKTNGTLWLWGFGDAGRLGINSTLDRSSPVQTVSGGTNWRQVCLGVNHSSAIKTDGSLWLWGSNFSTKLATNSTLNQSSPVQTVSGGTNWRQVSLGRDHSAAIRDEGEY